MKSLPVLNCDDCGACCTHIGTPPGYALYFPPPPHKVPVWAKKGDDWRLMQQMPAAIRAGLADYYRQVQAGEIRDRTADEQTPCLWYDADSRTCRHHEWRPTVCREFEVGCDACIKHRERVGVKAGVK